VKRIFSTLKKNIPKLRHEIARNRALEWVERGKVHLSQRAIEKALTCSKRALEIDNNSTAAYGLIADILMPGSDYYSILSHFHEYLKPESYVEIGVAEGKSLALASKNTKKIGIDPSPCIEKKIQPVAKLYPVTSDEFFLFYDLFEELGTAKLSLAFIDGSHLFEQVLNDFINLERYADKETVILIHDCMPINKLVASRIRWTDFWCGDVWKVIPSLIKYRPDLVINVIPTKPAGVGVINNLCPESTLLKENLDQIVSEYKHREISYDYLELKTFELAGVFPDLVPNDWQQIVHQLFSSSAF